MKKIMILCLSIALSGFLFKAQAQSEKVSEVMEVMQAYDETLEFTDEQKNELKAAFGTLQKESVAAWDEHKEDKNAYKKAQKDAFYGIDKKMQEVLSEEQLEKYKKNREDLKDKALKHFLGDKMK